MKTRVLNILKDLRFPFVIVLCFVVPALGQDAEIKEAVRLSDIEQNQKAIDLLTATANKYPKLARPLYYLGSAYVNMKKYNEASKIFGQGISIDEKEPLNYVGLGVLSLLENNQQKAETDFNKALSLSKSKDAFVLAAIARSYSEHKDLSGKVMSFLDKAKALKEQDAETVILLGDAYLAINNGGLAVTNYERAATIDPKSAKPHYKIGLVYLRSKNFKAAREGFEMALAIDKDYTPAYKELGELYYLTKDGPNAVRAYERYLSLTDNPEPAMMRYAFFLFMAKDFSKANQVFETLTKQDDVTPTVLRFYAYSLFEAGDIEKSSLTFDRYFSEAAQSEIDAADYSYYGKLLMNQGRDSLGLEQFKKSLQLRPDQPDILSEMAEIYFKQKKYSHASESFERLIAIRPKPLSQDLYHLGRSYYFDKQFEKAAVAFEKLIQLQPNMTVGYLWLGRSKSNLDPESEEGLAKPSYEAVIEKSAATQGKNKSELIEAYSYLGYFHFLKEDFTTSKTYWQKVLELDPQDAKAKEALKAIQ